MVTVRQIQQGFVNFGDREVAVAFDGWQKAIVGGCAGLLAANFPKTVATYSSHPLVAAMGIMDGDNINIDALYDAFVPKLNGSKIPIVIPKIGTIKLGKEEIDILMRYIKEA